MKMKFRDQLKEMDACSPAIAWVGSRSATQAWADCERADWMLWWAEKSKRCSRRDLAKAACQCARTALKFVPKGEERPRLAIEATEKWIKNPTKKNAAARDAARAAARAAAWDAAGDAAWAAARAAAGDAAAAAARAAAADAARDAALKEMADLIRWLEV